MNQHDDGHLRDDVDLRRSTRARTTKRRNLIVLIALAAFVAFAFTLSFSHVAREVGGSSRPL
ncbi:hypothetical protein [Bosea sp. (in: a-proteobacteria)]|uniref:hypothetical protein n=1 Tax=Bosea sp. (in: a-proteobacteria) TaxID=1871050 RepID=UPI00356B15C0